MKYLDDYDVLMSKRSQLDGLVFLRTLHPGPEGHTNHQSLPPQSCIIKNQNLNAGCGGVILINSLTGLPFFHEAAGVLWF